MRHERTRTEWRHVYLEDPHSGRPRLAFVFPHKIPVRVSTWKDRFRAPYGAFDLCILAAAVVLVVLSVVTR
jgi:hypothetical protein